MNFSQNLLKSLAISLPLVFSVACCEAKPKPKKSPAKTTAVVTGAAATGALVGTAISAGLPEGQLIAKINEKFPGANVESLRPAPIAGFYEMKLSGGLIGYVSADGKYAFEGDLIEIDTQKNLTELRRNEVRKNDMLALDNSNVITFSPAGKPKYSVSVFTDIDCGYCRKLHSEIAQYNAQGIEVRYAFFPRSGPGTPSFAKAVSVWCADDRKAAFTAAKQGLTVESKTCDNSIMLQYQTGLKVGLRGTPAMVLSDGELIGGYLPAAQLIQTLDKHFKK